MKKTVTSKDLSSSYSHHNIPNNLDIFNSEQIIADIVPKRPGRPRLHPAVSLTPRASVVRDSGANTHNTDNRATIGVIAIELVIYHQ